MRQLAPAVSDTHPSQKKKKNFAGASKCQFLYATAAHAMVALRLQALLQQSTKWKIDRFMTSMRKFATVSKVGQGCAVSAKVDLLCSSTPTTAAHFTEKPAIKQGDTDAARGGGRTLLAVCQVLLFIHCSSLTQRSSPVLPLTTQANLVTCSSFHRCF